MKTIVLYDSLYGNTAKIAQAIATVLAERGEVSLCKLGELRVDQIAGAGLFVVGSPTQRFRATDGLRNFLDSIPKNGLSGIRVAAFDTRLTSVEIDKNPPLPFFVRFFGFAAGRIARHLRAKGGELVVMPEGFYVHGMEGPLVDGELERAGAWARQLFA